MLLFVWPPIRFGTVAGSTRRALLPLTLTSHGRLSVVPRKTPLVGFAPALPPFCQKLEALRLLRVAALTGPEREMVGLWPPEEESGALTPTERMPVLASVVEPPSATLP